MNPHPNLTQQELDDHRTWNLTCGAQGKRLVKTGAYLRGAYLRGAYLTGAYLRGAYLTGADIRGAYLTDADLTGAYLRGAYLRGADLRGAYFRGADLRGPDGKDRKLIGRAPVISLSFGHDWDLILFNTDAGVVVNCGCRWFDSPEAARTHWLRHTQEQRQRVVLPALEALLAISETQEWPRIREEARKEKAA